MQTPQRVYLDNAATSWPKPDCVLDAMALYYQTLGAPSGRGAYREAAQVDKAVEDARLDIVRFIGGSEAKQLIFTLNGSDSLNYAIHGLLRPGDHVVTSVCEHNSVLRPLRYLQETIGIEVTYVPCDSEGVVDANEMLAAVRDETRLVALLHASNVTGALQPVEEVGQSLRDHAAFFLVDAAQSLGHVPVNVEEACIDLLAAPGHKGLLGPLGTGVLYIRPGVEKELFPYRQGGTGTTSDLDVQPDTLPEKYECGIHNVPAIMALGASVRFLKDRTVEAIHKHETERTEELIAGLRSIENITIYGPIEPAKRVGVVSFNMQGMDPQELATMLDVSHRVQARAGFHCAPRMHESLGTPPLGGTVRLSVGWSTTSEEIRQAIEAVEQAALMVV